MKQQPTKPEPYEGWPVHLVAQIKASEALGYAKGRGWPLPPMAEATALSVIKAQLVAERAARVRRRHIFREITSALVLALICVAVVAVVVLAVVLPVAFATR